MPDLLGLTIPAGLFEADTLGSEGMWEDMASRIWRGTSAGLAAQPSWWDALTRVVGGWMPSFGGLTSVMRPLGADATVPADTALREAMAAGGLTPQEAAAVDAPSSASWLDTLTRAAGAVKPFVQLAAPILGGVATVRGMQQAADLQRQLDRTRREIQQTSQPAAQAAAQIVPAAQQAMFGGPLPAGAEERVSQWYRDAVTRLRDQLVRAGLDESTAREQAEAWARSQREQLRQAEAESLLRGGLSATEVATRPLAGLAGSIGESLGHTEDAIARAQKVLMSYLAE